MRSTTLFGLHSQTTRLSERSTRSRRVPGVAYGIVTLLDVTVSGDLYPDDPPVTIGRKTTIREALGPPDFKLELRPLHSPLLRTSLLVSFPPVINMLKFTG
jgi:hypothetical protein